MQAGNTGPVRASEICELLGITSSLLTQWRKELKLPEVGKGKREIIYSRESYNKLCKLAENRDKAEEEKRLKKRGHYRLPANIEELQKEHPLVKDPRCFILEWFPEV